MKKTSAEIGQANSAAETPARPAKTFEELAADPVGTVYVDKIADGIRFLVMRGPTSLCAYVGVPLDHPIAGMDYNDIDLQVHGGLTFGREGAGTFPAGWYWYGWDYSHCDDKSFYDLKYNSSRNGKPWTVEDVVKDSEWEACYNFRKFCSLAEKIFEKGKLKGLELAAVNRVTP